MRSCNGPEHPRKNLDSKSMVTPEKSGNDLGENISYLMWAPITPLYHRSFSFSSFHVLTQDHVNYI